MLTGRTHMAESALRNAELLEPSRRRLGGRAVPQDWFLDPVDADGAESAQRPVELRALPELGAQDLEGSSEELPASIWQSVAGVYGVEEDQGQLAWQTDALCAQTDPEAFFPEKGGSTRDAKRVCAACPVSEACLDYAMEHDEKFGIWGGLSERERRRLRRAGR